MSVAPSPEIDPTRSKTKRRAFEREFRGRWRDVRGAVRQLIEGDRHYRPESATANSIQVADFRQWLETQLEDTVVDRTPHRGVRRGRHYTAPYVRDLYRHGIKRADQSLEQIGMEFTAPKAEAAIRHDPHKDPLAGFYVEVYQDLEDAARAAEKEATRAYRAAVREEASATDTIQRLNGRENPRGRLRAIGETRTNMVARSKAVVIINTAAAHRYQQIGLDRVGVQVEALPDDAEFEASSQHAHAHDALQDGDELPGEGDGEGDDDEDRTSPHEAEPEPGSVDQKHQWATTGDDLVCPECAGLDGMDMWIQDVIMGVAPMPVRDTHPGCRCFLQPTPIFDNPDQGEGYDVTEEDTPDADAPTSESDT